MKQFETIWNFKGKEQIARLLDKTIKVREKSFIKDFWIPIGLYNEAIRLRNGAKEPFLARWVATVDRFLEGKPVDRIESSKVKFTIQRVKDKFESVIEAKVSDLLWLWLWYAIRGDLIVRTCEAEDCSRIFTPAGRKDQTFCSNRCRMRITMRRIKKRKELRARKTEGSRLSLSKSS